MPGNEYRNESIKNVALMMVAVPGMPGGLLLADGFASDNQDTADFGKMMGTGSLVAGGLNAGAASFS